MYVCVYEGRCVAMLKGGYVGMGEGGRGGDC